MPDAAEAHPEARRILRRYSTMTAREIRRAGPEWVDVKRRDHEACAVCGCPDVAVTIYEATKGPRPNVLLESRCCTRCGHRDEHFVADVPNAGCTPLDWTPRPAAFYASVDTVDVDRDTHREKRPIRFYHNDGRPIQPGDLLKTRAQVTVSGDALRERGVDPDSVIVARIREDANVDAPAGSIGVFEDAESDAVRFLGTLSEIGGRVVSE